jgi:uncharacterized protein (TIGR02996 family)
MPRDTSLDSLYLTLDAEPGDRVTMLALADWYEEHDQPDAADCLRWTVEGRLWPFLYRRDGAMAVCCQTWHDRWFWWAVSDKDYGRDWGHAPECRLPFALWKRLKHTFKYDPAVFKEYPSRRAAYEALFAAWPGYRKRA